MADHNWKVGQTVYVVPGQSRHPYEAVIEKVGRDWATLAGGRGRMRFDLLSGHLDSERCIRGRVYESREAHATETARAEAWSELWHLMQRQYSAPSTTTIGAIETARELLFGARVKEASNG